MRHAFEFEGRPDDIQVTKHPAPEVPRHIEETLLGMTPRVFLIWNGAWKKQRGRDDLQYEGRWEIWIELQEVSHPDASNELSDEDRWNSEHQCWMRKLQTYKTEDGDFAPADQRLIEGLRLADAWSNERLYEETVGAADQRRKERTRERLREGARASRSRNKWAGQPVIQAGKDL